MIWWPSSQWLSDCHPTAQYPLLSSPSCAASGAEPTSEAAQQNRSWRRNYFQLGSACSLNQLTVESWQGKAWSNKRVRGRWGWGLEKRNWESWLGHLGTSSGHPSEGFQPKCLLSAASVMMCDKELVLPSFQFHFSDKRRRRRKEKSNSSKEVKFSLKCLCSSTACDVTEPTASHAQPQLPAPGRERCASMTTAPRPLRVPLILFSALCL